MSFAIGRHSTCSKKKKETGSFPKEFYFKRGSSEELMGKRKIGKGVGRKRWWED